MVINVLFLFLNLLKLMTINTFLESFSNYENYALIYFGLMPLLGLLFSKLHKITIYHNVYDYILSIVVFGTTIPGISSLSLLFYSIFLLNENILNVNVILYFLPIISMILSLFIISRRVSFNRLPGFNKLWSLIIILLIVHIIIFFLFRLHFVIGFFSSFTSLFIIGVILFLILKYAANKLFNS